MFTNNVLPAPFSLTLNTRAREGYGGHFVCCSVLLSFIKVHKDGQLLALKWISISSKQKVK